MFFANPPEEKAPAQDGEKLCVFGPRKDRRAAELKLISEITRTAPSEYWDTRKTRIITRILNLFDWIFNIFLQCFK